MAEKRITRLIDAAEQAVRDGSFTRAISLYKTAVRLDPNHPAPYLHLADLYLALEMDNEARRAAKAALTHGVSSGDVRVGGAALAYLAVMESPRDPS